MFEVSRERYRIGPSSDHQDRRRLGAWHDSTVRNLLARAGCSVG
jgi:hypothetical protein